MTSKRLWTALVTFTRGDDTFGVLSSWYEGATGSLATFANDADEAQARIFREVERCGFRQIEVEQLQEIDVDDMVDKHLAANARDLAANLRDAAPCNDTVWGTLHMWIGEGEA